MSNLVKVKDHNLVKDMNTGVIQSTDREAYLKFIAERKTREENKQRLSTLEEDVHGLNDRVGELQNTLDEILKVLKGGSNAKKQN